MYPSRSPASSEPSGHEPAGDALPAPLAPGTLIGEAWVVERQLGAGGMGSVYRCHNRSTERLVMAIKLLDPAWKDANEARERFLREAEILSTLEHPNIVRVAKIDLDNDPPYLEMECVDGSNLEEDLTQNGACTSEVGHRRALDVARALQHLHRKRIYHRDL